MSWSSRSRISPAEETGPFVRLAFDADVERVSGEYFHRYRREAVPRRLASHDLAQRLFQVGVKLTGAPPDLVANRSR